MREATIGDLSALDSPRPRKGAAPARPKQGGPATRPQGFGPGFKRARAHLILVIGSAGFTAMMVGIVYNATVMQKEHHPAPLFGSAAPPRTVAALPASSPPADLAPLLVPAPAVTSASAAVATPAVATAPSEPAAPVPAAPVASAHRPLAKAGTHGGAPSHASKIDAIARLLGPAGHGTRAGGPARMAATTTVETRTAGSKAVALKAPATPALAGRSSATHHDRALAAAAAN